MMTFKHFAPTSYNSNVEQIANSLFKVLVIMTLILLATHANAADSDLFDLPVVNEVLCGAQAYLRTKFAPIVAVLVIAGAGIGHWLGAGKFWGTIVVVLLILGAILGIAAMIARFSGVSAACLV